MRLGSPESKFTGSPVERFLIPLESQLALVTLLDGPVLAPFEEGRARRRFTGGEKRTRFNFCVLLDAVLLTAGEGWLAFGAGSSGGLWNNALLGASLESVWDCLATGKLRVRFLADDPGVFRRPGVRRLGVRPLLFRRLSDFLKCVKMENSLTNSGHG